MHAIHTVISLRVIVAYCFDFSVRTNITTKTSLIQNNVLKCMVVSMHVDDVNSIDKSNLSLRV